MSDNPEFYRGQEMNNHARNQVENLRTDLHKEIEKINKKLDKLEEKLKEVDRLNRKVLKIACALNIPL